MGLQRKISPENYTDSDILILETGHNFFHDKTCLDPADLPACRAAWSVLADKAMAATRERFGPFVRPWAWWKFVADVDRPSNSKDEKTFLLEHREFLTSEEKFILSEPAK
jgi:hypothetical protein